MIVFVLIVLGFGFVLFAAYAAKTDKKFALVLCLCFATILMLPVMIAQGIALERDYGWAFSETALDEESE